MANKKENNWFFSSNNPALQNQPDFCYHGIFALIVWGTPVTYALFLLPASKSFWVIGSDVQSLVQLSPIIIWHYFKKYGFHCWNWKSHCLDLYFPDNRLVYVLSSGSISSYSWTFPVKIEVSCIRTGFSVWTSRRVCDADWCTLRGVITGHIPICESTVYHLVEVCWPPVRGNLFPSGDGYPQIDLLSYVRSYAPCHYINLWSTSCKGADSVAVSLLKLWSLHGDIDFHNWRLIKTPASLGSLLILSPKCFSVTCVYF